MQAASWWKPLNQQRSIMSTTKRPSINKAAALVAMVVGIAGGSYGIASAASGSTTSSSTASTASVTPAHGTAAHENAESAVTGAAAAKAQAAAVASVGSGTAGAVTSDMTGTGYETTVTKADGSTVEVHLDSSYSAFQGHSGPAAPGA
jgi:hypothetical protein